MLGKHLRQEVARRTLRPQTPHTTHSTLNNVHSTLYTAQSTPHTAHCTLHTAHYQLHTGHCTLHTVHCTLHTAHCKLHTAHCTFNLAELATPSKAIWLLLSCTSCTVHSSNVHFNPKNSSSKTTSLLIKHGGYHHRMTCGFWWRGVIVPSVSGSCEFECDTCETGVKCRTKQPC